MSFFDALMGSRSLGDFKGEATIPWWMLQKFSFGEKDGGIYKTSRCKITVERRGKERVMEPGLKKTPLNAWHREPGGQMVEFGGWEMPITYKRGIIEEHLGTRRFGGLFDISHVGRFSISEKMLFLSCFMF